MSGYDFVNAGATSAEVPMGGKVDLLIKLAATGKLIVTVKKAEGGFVQGAKVTAKGPVKRNHPHTPTNGQVIFEYIPTGTYTITASKKERTVATKEVKINRANEKVLVQLSLHKAVRRPTQVFRIRTQRLVRHDDKEVYFHDDLI